MFNKTISSSLAVLFAAGSLFIQAGTVLAQEKPKSAAQIKFETLDSKQDQAAIIALWREHPGKTAFIIDSYLEGGLALFEQSGVAAQNEIKAMYDRGLRGALAADKAFGRKIFADYASSFIGWDDEQKKQFRFGQQAYGKAKKALENKQFKAALASATESTNAARPLGDWWGVAVAQAVAGAAQEELHNPQSALEAFSEARFIFHNFGMMEYLLPSEVAMSRLLVELKRFPRALVTIESAAALALQHKNTVAQEELKMLRAKITE